jgi:chaperone required for assembly of F1-ATPase
VIAPKRFWTEVHVAETPGGFGIRLDARVLRTPARAELIVPTRALAEAIAAEWRAVEGEIRPEALPFTRAANVAVDRIAADPGPLVAHLAAYGETDLLCYRAEGPVGLQARQAAAWDPALAWAARDLGAPLAVTEGVAHRAQDPASLAALHAAVGAHDAFALTALSELVTLSGSLVLGLAVARGALGAPEAWAASRLDETWQEEQWGVDDEAAEMARVRENDFLRAATLLELLADGRAPLAQP